MPPRSLNRTLWAQGRSGGLESDETQLSFALSEHRVVVSYDPDFLRLHALGVEHAGIAFAPRLMSTGALVRRLLLIHDVLTAEDMQGHVEFL